jgi:hypothetical protein
MKKEQTPKRQPRDSMDQHSQEGTCSDCSQGLLIKQGEGFAHWDQRGDGRGFWYCCYCGSNHVTVLLESGEVVEQDDLYGSDGLLNF